MPLAICLPSLVPGNRVVDDVVSLTDLAPTILELAGVKHPVANGENNSMIGKSLVPLLKSKESGLTRFSREEVYSCRERHSFLSLGKLDLSAALYPNLSISFNQEYETGAVACRSAKKVAVW